MVAAAPQIHHKRSNSLIDGSSVAGGGHHHNQHHRPRSNSHSHRPRSNSHSSHDNNHHTRKPQTRGDLWKGCINKDIGNSIIVQIVGMQASNHTVYARVDPNCSASSESLSAVPIGKVIETMVSEGWRHVAKEILEKHIHIETADAYPTASELLKLGAVWILNEAAYAKGDSYNAHRLTPADESKVGVDWSDMTLRVQ